MEWVILALILAAAGAFIAWPRGAEAPDARDYAADLRDEFAMLAAAVRELDEDLAAGRITPEDRARERADLGARLREVAEALRALGGPVAP